MTLLLSSYGVGGNGQSSQRLLGHSTNYCVCSYNLESGNKLHVISGMHSLWLDTKLYKKYSENVIPLK